MSSRLINAKSIQREGFTIVELLIVIVVIGILAAITIVAYNGISTRAENNKTISAAAAYYKAIKMYEVDNGEVPHASFDGCIGENYPWDYSGGTSGDNQCRYANRSYYTVHGTINTILKGYLGNQLPAPSMQTVGTPTYWARGITYVTPAVGGDLQLYVALKDISTCPSIAGLSSSSESRTYDNGLGCSYPVGKRLR